MYISSRISATAPAMRIGAAQSRDQVVPFADTFPYLQDYAVIDEGENFSDLQLSIWPEQRDGWWYMLSERGHQYAFCPAGTIRKFRAPFGLTNRRVIMSHERDIAQGNELEWELSLYKRML